MGGRSDSRRRPKGRIDAAAKEDFLSALRNGAPLEDAARAAGFSLPGFYGARKKDSAFKAAWAEALAVSADNERIIAPNNKRRLQRRRMRHVKFSEERRAAFLGHFAGSGDADEAASVAGVCRSTVYKHCAKDSAFAAAFQEALDQCYVALEAEALRQRLVALRKLRDGAIPTGEVTAEFDRVMKMLARWDRKGGRAGPRTISPGKRHAVTFDEAIEALHERLQALAIPIARLPEPEEGEGGTS